MRAFLKRTPSLLIYHEEDAKLIELGPAKTVVITVTLERRPRGRKRKDDGISAANLAFDYIRPGVVRLAGPTDTLRVSVFSRF